MKIVADSLNISKIGLLMAKKRGLIDNAVSLLHELRAAGYWLSDEVIAVARKLAEE